MNRAGQVGVLSIVVIATVSMAYPFSLRITDTRQESNQPERAREKGQPSNNNREPLAQTQDLTQWPMECEGAALRLDNAVIETEKLSESYLIIVARLGTGETSSRLNRIRLAVAQEYILRRGSGFKYVLAQGDRVRGLGRLEFYVGGQLKDILPLRKNSKGYCVPGRGWGG